ncbi:MAG: hypothetical protein LBJ88_01275 [Campylobacteraceae bacterium]|jgi:hypothetical protein|nr:hypothetical protein [Campylobacteraceae bacterium]
MKRKNDYNNFQLNKISKEAFVKERGGFLRFFAILLFIIIFLLCVVFRIKELFVYLGVVFFYLLAVASFIRGMNKDYRLSPTSVKIDGNYIDVCYEHTSIQLLLNEIDYIAQFYTRRFKYGISTKSIFRGYSKGKEFWLGYEYLEESYRLTKFIKEGWINKKDEHDLQVLKRESKTYELKDKRIVYISIENIKSLQLLSNPWYEHVELHVYNDKNKKYVFNILKKKLALIIIKCYKIESLYNIPFKWHNNSYVPFFEDKLSTIYKKS